MTAPEALLKIAGLCEITPNPTAVEAFVKMYRLYRERAAMQSVGITPSDALLAEQHQAAEAFHAAGGHDAAAAEMKAWLDRVQP